MGWCSLSWAFATRCVLGAWLKEHLIARSPFERGERRQGDTGWRRRRDPLLPTPRLETDVAGLNNGRVCSVLRVEQYFSKMVLIGYWKRIIKWSV